MARSRISRHQAVLRSLRRHVSGVYYINSNLSVERAVSKLLACASTTLLTRGREDCVRDALSLLFCVAETYSIPEQDYGARAYFEYLVRCNDIEFIRKLFANHKWLVVEKREQAEVVEGYLPLMVYDINKPDHLQQEWILFREPFGAELFRLVNQS